MTDFDDILKKGKKSVPGIGTVDVDAEWKNTIGYILYSLQYLNDLYGGDHKQHQVQSIEKVRCYKCSEATYLLRLYDLATKSTIMTFHSSDWEAINSSTYICKKCKTP